MSTTVAPGPGPSPLIGFSPAQLIDTYLKLRNKTAEIKEAHKKQLAPYSEMMVSIEGELLRKLQEQGLDNMKAGSGTAYKSTKTSATVSEWSKTLEWIRDNDAWELLEARVSKTAALAIIEETKQPIPGVNVRQEVELHVRAASA